MEKLRLKIILSVLWIALVVNHIAYILQDSIKPEDMNELMSVAPETAMYSLTIFFFIPCFIICIYQP